MSKQKFSPEKFATALSKLEKIILNSLDFDDVVCKIVNETMYELDKLNLGYRIVVLGLIDKKNNVLRRHSISNSDEAEKAIKAIPIQFKDIETPLSCGENYCIRAMNENNYLVTDDWVNILTPPLTPEQARASQKNAEIKTSMIFPLTIQHEPIGMIIFSTKRNQNEISNEEKQYLNRFVEFIAIAVQNSRLFSSLNKSKKDLQLAHDRLHRLSKLRNEFVAITAHDLRTPLTILRNYLWQIELALTEKQENKILQDIVICIHAVDRMIYLVNNTLTVSKLESGNIRMERSLNDLIAILRETTKEFNILGNEREIQITYESKIDVLEEFLFDRNRIREVMINLINNALHYTPNRGKIKVTLEMLEDNKFVKVSVSDTGIGIPPEAMNKLFKRFSRVEQGTPIYTPEATGTGLGLYICKQIIEIHEGQIGVSSKVGEGTTFWFTLPFVKEGKTILEPKHKNNHDIAEDIEEIEELTHSG